MLYVYLIENGSYILYEELEDTKGITRSRKPHKNRRYNAKGQTNQTIIYKAIHRNLNIEHHELGMKSGFPEEIAVPAPTVTPI